MIEPKRLIVHAKSVGWEMVHEVPRDLTIDAILMSAWLVLIRGATAMAILQTVIDGAAILVGDTAFRCVMKEWMQIKQEMLAAHEIIINFYSRYEHLYLTEDGELNGHHPEDIL